MYSIRTLDFHHERNVATDNEDHKMRSMTDKQAYAAMYYFLEDFWKRTKSEGVGNLLSFMSLLPDGSPADPAVTNDWRRAVDYALEGGQPGSLTLK